MMGKSNDKHPDCLPFPGKYRRSYFRKMASENAARICDCIFNDPLLWQSPWESECVTALKNGAIPCQRWIYEVRMSLPHYWARWSHDHPDIMSGLRKYGRNIAPLSDMAAKKAARAFSHKQWFLSLGLEAATGKRRLYKKRYLLKRELCQ